MSESLGELNEYVNRYPSLSKFVTLFRRGRIARTTAENYVRSIRFLVQELGLQDPEYALETLRQMENVEDYLNGIIDDLAKKEFSGGRISGLFKALRMWLRITGVDVDWGKVIVPAEESIVEDRAPTKDELRRLSAVAGLRDQAIILVASSSGLRLNTLLTLKVGDVNFNYPDVARIIVTKGYKIGDKEFKSGRKIAKKRSFYVTFITPEARRALEDYLQYRRESGERITNDSPLFTGVLRNRQGTFLHKTTYDGHWERLLKRAHLNEKGAKWFTLHFHVMKKYAETRMINAGVNASYREFFLGHKGAYLEANYFRGEEEKCLEEYRKAIPELSIAEKPEVTAEEIRRAVREEIEDERLEKIAKRFNVSIERIKAALYMRRGKEFMTDEDIENLLKEAKIIKPKTSDCQRVITEEELQRFLNEGWKVQCVLPSGKLVISSE